MKVLRTSLSGAWSKAALVAVFTLIALTSAIGQYQDLYDFPVSPMDGSIVLDSAGNIYGTAETYPTLEGSAFELAMPGDSLVTLHSFTGSPDGSNPNAPLAFDRAGDLYGTTINGGVYNAGTVFELFYSENQWSERILHSFTGGSDGGNPRAGVLLDNAGHLYGTTTTGGAYNSGVVYRLNVAAAPVEAVLHSFGGPNDAQFPTGTLIRDAAGNLYGEATGGAYQAGIVYELSPVSRNFGWAETILYAFNIYSGAGPNGGVVFDTSGNLYGVTTNVDGACGAAFELMPRSGGNWSESVIHAFQGPDGCSPVGPVTFDSSGNLYIATQTDGANQTGTIDELTPSAGGQWTETTLFSFPNVLYLHSNGGLVFDAHGNLYGTYNSDSHSGVYEFTP